MIVPFISISDSPKF